MSPDMEALARRAVTDAQAQRLDDLYAAIRAAKARLDAANDAVRAARSELEELWDERDVLLDEIAEEEA